MKVTELADIKYLPYADQYIGMAHGDGYEHLKRFLKNRLIFTDTLFDYAPSYNNDVLTIRANTTEPMTITIETYTPVYQHLSWYNGQMDKVKIDGKTAVTFTGTAQTATDQEVLIYGGSNIKKITGISSMNPNSMLIGSATRLTELIAPDCPLLTDINSNKANLSAHTYLNKLDLSNCPNLGGTLRLNNSQLIQDINMKGTAITSINMPTSIRNLEVLRLPNTITELTLNDVPLLNTLEFDEGVVINSVSMTNCNALTNCINFDLTKTPTVLLDNSYDIEELYMSATTNLTLRNMKNMERLIYIPNNEYETFELATLTGSNDYSITTFNCPKLTDFITTAPHRLSYNNGDYGDIKPNTTFTANTLDLSNTQFSNIKFLCTTDLYKLKLPTTLKNFYCDSAFDIDTDVIEDASYEVIHDELIKQYTTDYSEEVTLNDTVPNIIPSSSDGSLIFSMYAPSKTTEPSAGVWDLYGLELQDFYTYGMNNDIVADTDGNITMPCRYTPYSVQIKNADITPNEYPTMLYPLLVDTTLPITGKLDYTKYNGTSLAWAYAYTTDDVTINPLDSQHQGNITNDYNKLYGTDYVDIVDVWVYKDTDVSGYSTNENIIKAYIELTSDNYTTRIDEVLQYYPNCTDLYFFEDGSVTTLNSMFNNNNNTNTKNQIVKVSFIEGYFENVDSMYNTFGNCINLKTSNLPNNVIKIHGCFQGCEKLERVENIPSTVDYLYSTFNSCFSFNQQLDLSNLELNNNGLKDVFNSCSSLEYAPILPSNYTGSMANCFYGCSKLVEAPVLPDGVTNLAQCFQNCTSLTTVPNIPSNCNNFDNTFGGCKALISVSSDGYKGNTQYTFANCTSLNQQINILNTTSLYGTFKNCTSLSITPTLPESANCSMSNCFYGCTSLVTPPITPEGVTNMSSCYQMCTALTTAPNIPNTCTDIMALCYWCYNIPSITLPIGNNFTNIVNCLNGVKSVDITWTGEVTTNLDISKFNTNISEIDIHELVPEHLADLYKDTIKVSFIDKKITINGTDTTWE